MKTPVNWLIVSGVVLAMAVQLSAQTVTSITLGKGVENVQTDATTVVPNPQTPGPTYGGAYGFGVSVEGTGLTNPTVTLAVGSTMPSTNSTAHNGGALGYNSEDGEWQYGSPNFNNWGATTAGVIDTLFASGDYTVSSPTTEFPSVTLTLGTSLANISSVIANAPMFTLTGGNWANGVYVVNVNATVTITSNVFTEFSANADGHIAFDLWQHNGGFSDYTESLYSADTNADNFISYTINPNTLISGQTYNADGSFAAVLDKDSTISGALVASFLERSTSFTISAVPEPSTYALLTGMLLLGWVLRRRHCV